MYSPFHAIKNVLPLFTLCHFDQCSWNYIGSDATINVCISTQTKRISSSFSFCKKRNRILAAHLHLLVEIVKRPATLKEKNEKNIFTLRSREPFQNELAKVEQKGKLNDKEERKCS